MEGAQGLLLAVIAREATGAHGVPSAPGPREGKRGREGESTGKEKKEGRGRDGPSDGCCCSGRQSPMEKHRRGGGSRAAGLEEIEERSGGCGGVGEAAAGFGGCGGGQWRLADG